MLLSALCSVPGPAPRPLSWLVWQCGIAAPCRRKGNEELCWEMLLPIPYSPHRDGPCSVGTLPRPMGPQSFHPTPRTPGSEV